MHTHWPTVIRSLGGWGLQAAAGSLLPARSGCILVEAKRPRSSTADGLRGPGDRDEI